MAVPGANTPLEKTVRGILALVQKIIRERGHGQVVITIRDGKIALISDTRTYVPENLPEA
jgi:hypothetical protein